MRVVVNETAEYSLRSGCGHCCDRKGLDHLCLEKCCVFCRLILILTCFLSLYSVCETGPCLPADRQDLAEGSSLTHLRTSVSVLLLAQCPWLLLDDAISVIEQPA